MATPTSKGAGLSARLTRKVGPLPVWAWAVVILAGGYLVYKLRKPSAAAASQSTAVPVTPDVTGSPTAGSVGSGGATDTGGLSSAPLDLSPLTQGFQGIGDQLSQLEQQLQAQSALLASGYGQGGPPGSTDQGVAAAPASSTPVSAYHPAYHPVAATAPNFARAATAQTRALGPSAPFGGVTSTRTTSSGARITTYASGRQVEQAPGHTAYVIKK